MSRKVQIIVMAVLALFLGLAAEFLIAWYEADRGYGNESAGYPMEVLQIQDYETDGQNWHVTGPEPYMIFGASEGERLGHIRLVFSEPVASDVYVVLYYSRDSQTPFNRYKCRSRYMTRGTREARLTLPTGSWRYYRLEIRGSFSAESMTLVPSPGASEGMKNVPGALRPWRALLIALFLFAGFSLPVRSRTATGSQAGRKYYLDALRTLAAFSVVAVHLLEPVSMAIPPGTGLRLTADALVLLFLTSNPLFLMLSGALLLPKYDEPADIFIRKRLKAVLIPFLVYAAVYVRMRCMTTASLGEWISCYLRTVISGDFTLSAPHLWLIYVLLGLYLSVIPFRCLLKHLTEKGQKWLTVLILVFLALRTYTLYSGMAIGITAFWGDWPGVFLLGFFLNAGWMRKYDKYVVIGGGAAFAASVWLAATRADFKGIVCNQSILMILMASAIFVLLLRVDRWFAPLKRFLAACSRNSYSILLAHWFVLYMVIIDGGVPGRLGNLMGLVFGYLLCLALSFGLSVFVDRFVVSVLSRGISFAADLVLAARNTAKNKFPQTP